jgi:hypothetical protein
MEMDRVQVTNTSGQSVWINRLLISGTAGSVLIMLVAYELHKKLYSHKSWSSLLKKLKILPGCGLASAEQLALIKRAHVVSARASSAQLITVAAAQTMFSGAPELKQALDAICCLPNEAPPARWAAGFRGALI